jgi:anaerobic magnesium-protoporphyrin IX monomethyl ester cyclase
VLVLDRDFVVSAAKELKKDYAPIIVVGGPHPTLSPEDLLKNKNIDFVIRGAGEFSFSRLIESLDKQESCRNIEGLCYQSNGQRHIGDITTVSDLNSLPLASYGRIDLKRYLKENKGTILYEASRGCIYRCRHCSLWKMCNNKFYLANKQKVLSDLQKIVTLSKLIQSIGFVDNTLNSTKQRILDIAKTMRSLSIFAKRRIGWSCLIRAEGFSREAVKKLKESGLETVFIGFESANLNTLKYLRRSIKIKEMLSIIEIFMKREITTAISFQIGFPWETKEQMQRTVDLAIRLEKEGATTTLYKFTPFPGIDIDIGLAQRRQKSRVRFAVRPTSKSKRLAFKHPLVKDGQIEEVVKNYRQVKKAMLAIAALEKRKTEKSRLTYKTSV